MASKSFQHDKHSYTISYEILNPLAKHELIILHGWGSNKEIMKKAFGSYLDTFKHIYIDLPGFGASLNDAVLDTAAYAEVLEVFLELLGAKKELIMGHSFGGKVATLLNPNYLILLSTAGIKMPKPLNVQAKIKMTKVFNALGIKKLSKTFRAKDADQLTPAMYETFKKVVDEDFSHVFSTFNNKALICWGKEDTATPLKAGEKIASLIKKSTFISYEGDHFFFLKHASSISEQIQKEYVK